MKTALWLALRQGRAGFARQAVIAVASLVATVIALTSTAFWQAWGRQDQRRAALSPLQSTGGWTEDRRCWPASTPHGQSPTPATETAG